MTSSPAATIPHPEHRRRRDARMPGGDPRHLDLRPARGARADGADRTPRQARHDRLGQRNRVHLERRVRLGARQQGRLAFHCARKADAERLLREFQRAHARRASQREPVPRPRSCAIKDRELDRRLQPAAPAFGSGLSLRQRTMPPISPQHAIVCATPTSSADRMLLHPRPTA